MNIDELKSSKKISSEAYENLKLWLEDPSYQSFRKDIQELLDKNDIAVIEDSFYKHIEIGTGGIRGPIGVGPNRINFQTIGEAAQGLSNFIEDFGEGDLGLYGHFFPREILSLSKARLDKRLSQFLIWKKSH